MKSCQLAYKIDNSLSFYLVNKEIEKKLETNDWDKKGPCRLIKTFKNKPDKVLICFKNRFIILNRTEIYVGAKDPCTYYKEVSLQTLLNTIRSN